MKGVDLLSVNSFFAGIGGFDLGFKKNGFHTQSLVEINKFCQQVLKKHWPKTPLYDDVTALHDITIPSASVWCGGFPCQDVSVARGAKGREGLNGKRSGLFFPFYDLVLRYKPKIVLLENVVGLLSSHKGKDFATILDLFNKAGYAVSWRVLNSRFFGVPQSRPRVFIACVLDDADAAVEILYEHQKGARPKNLRSGFIETNICRNTGAKVASTAYCLAATSGRHTGTDWSRTYVSYDDAVRRLTPSECEGLQGFPTDWTAVTDKSIDTDSLRYHALGNAVSVPVATWISGRIKDYLLRSSKSDALDTKSFPDFENVRKISSEVLTNELLEIKWRRGGLSHNNMVLDINSPFSPNRPIESNLVDLLEKSRPDSRYFISRNAAVGIIRRVDSQNRSLFPPMRMALEKMIAVENISE